MSDPNFASPPPPPGDFAPGDYRRNDADGPAMSTPATLTGIFFEPSTTFDALRARPRFLVAAIIMIVSIFAFTFTVYQRFGFENVIRQAIESSPRTADMTPEQKDRAIEMQTGTFFKAISYASPLIGVLLIIFIGGGLYLLGAMSLGKTMSYKQAVSVWTYSSLPPIVLSMLLNIVLLFLKSPEDIDMASVNRGLVHANPGILIDAAAHPVLGTMLGSLDLFTLYGLVLAAIGMRRVARLTTGSAWAIVISIWLIGLLVRLALAAFTGSAMA